MPSSKQDMDTGTANSQQLWYCDTLGPHKPGPPEVSRRRGKDLTAPPHTADLLATDRSQGNKKHPYQIVYQPLVSPSALMVRSKLTGSGLINLCGTLNQTKTSKQERETAGGRRGELVKETKGSKRHACINVVKSKIYLYIEAIDTLKEKQFLSLAK